jgi:holo-[acyl-carrier protein] synthase
MILRTGVDLIEIDRIATMVSRHGAHFLERVYTQTELELCNRRTESLAGRYAAKEAVAKALGSGIGEISWQEIEILEDELNAPVIKLHGTAASRAERLDLSNWSVSISHSHSHAISVAVAISS